METKPFHESIVDAIDRCTHSQFGVVKLTALVHLLLETKIPENHDNILNALAQFGHPNEALYEKLVEKLTRERHESQSLNQV